MAKLISAVEKSIDAEYESNPPELGFALVFAYAEHEALTEMVNEIEKLLDLCRRLFGTSSWIDRTTLSLLDPQSVSDTANWTCATPS